MISMLLYLQTLRPYTPLPATAYLQGKSFQAQLSDSSMLDATLAFELHRSAQGSAPEQADALRPYLQGIELIAQQHLTAMPASELRGPHLERALALTTNAVNDYLEQKNAPATVYSVLATKLLIKQN